MKTVATAILAAMELLFALPGFAQNSLLPSPTTTIAELPGSYLRGSGGFV